MPGFEALYKDTVTVFNRKTIGDKVIWYPIVIPNVHLIMDRSMIISTYGEQSTDNARLHIRYNPRSGGAFVPTKKGELEYMLPKRYRREGDPDLNITFAFGEDFDFIVPGAYAGEYEIDDDSYSKGFYNYMNKEYDEVFAITSVSKFNLIPHFEIGAR